MTKRLVNQGYTEIIEIQHEINAQLKSGYKDQFMIRYTDGTVKILSFEGLNKDWPFISKDLRAVDSI